MSAVTPDFKWSREIAAEHRQLLAQTKAAKCKAKTRAGIDLAGLHDLSAVAIRLLLLLIDKSNPYTLRCDPGQNSLADRLGCTDRAIRGALKQLKDAGLVCWHSHGAQRTNCNAYHLNWPVLIGEEQTGSALPIEAEACFRQTLKGSFEGT